jgi:nitrogenase-associated protein
MMATIVFYEKPGCGNNTKQKVWLAASGHTVLAKNLLKEKWTAERLRLFFGDLPVAQWFNPAAPRVKSGEVDPATLDAQTALELMLAEPLLIRRPLMEVEGELRVGFDAAAVHAWIGLNDAKPEGDIEACPKSHQANPCPTPEAPSPQSSGGTTSQSTKPASGQVAGYPACGGGSKREQPCSTLEHSHA